MTDNFAANICSWHSLRTNPLAQSLGQVKLDFRQVKNMKEFV
jgi:hypothetical protein